MSAGSLLIFPADPAASPPALAALLGLLAESGLIGEPLPGRPGAYRVGHGFLRHVTFLGCSPHLVLDPPEDGGDAFSHVAVLGPYDSPHLLVGDNTVAPRCRTCRAAFADWRAEALAWMSHPDATVATCPACEARQAPVALDWRETAAVGRVLVDVRNVFPGEGVPGDELLDRLAKLSGGPWRYAWVHRRGR